MVESIANASGWKPVPLVGWVAGWFPLAYPWAHFPPVPAGVHVRPDLAPSALTIPRFGYGLMIALVSLGAVLIGLGTTWLLGGSQPSILLVGGALAAGAVVSLIPALLMISAEFWGVSVMVAGVARGLVVLVVVFVATENNPDLSKRAIYLGAMVGTVLVLIVETAAAVTILSKIERAKLAAKNSVSTNQPGRSMASAEHA